MRTLHTSLFGTGIGAAIVCAGLWVVFALMPTALASGDHRAPDLPSPLCDDVRVPPGNKAAFRVFAQGVQIYKWNGESWTFVAPMAKLYADPYFKKQVGIHYGGPTWESNNGSKVVGVPLTRCAPDPTAIPWLLLRAVSTDAPGDFNPVTYIHRVATTGGLAPSMPGASIGAVAEIPYTAEYYFYRAEE
jgi:hypothetical protein